MTQQLIDRTKESPTRNQQLELNLPGLKVLRDCRQFGKLPVEVIQLIGGVEYKNCYFFNRKLQALMPQLESNIIVRMHNLRTINSVGVATLFSLFLHTKKQNGTFILVGVNTFIREVFTLVKIPDSIQIVDSIEEAVNSLL